MTFVAPGGHRGPAAAPEPLAAPAPGRGGLRRALSLEGRPGPLEAVPGLPAAPVPVETPPPVGGGGNRRLRFGPGPAGGPEPGHSVLPARVQRQARPGGGAPAPRAAGVWCGMEAVRASLAGARCVAAGTHGAVLLPAGIPAPGALRPPFRLLVLGGSGGGPGPERPRWPPPPRICWSASRTGNCCTRPARPVTRRWSTAASTSTPATPWCRSWTPWTGSWKPPAWCSPARGQHLRRAQGMRPPGPAGASCPQRRQPPGHERPRHGRRGAGGKCWSRARPSPPTWPGKRPGSWAIRSAWRPVPAGAEPGVAACLDDLNAVMSR